ncbi:Protein CBG25301 [Caenorhabditis briggsae]|uniref:Protein CBG25301 n=1 Tax=Caenorhabditis briggsae TaxID=6238 RepID=B6IIH1_CAEBR|nr:Protein CBG25301 [Caenorhabditis briggsae]CAR99701.1 Protein CBG25301 [Caenorhabditis briggsae]
MFRVFQITRRVFKVSLQKSSTVFNFLSRIRFSKNQADTSNSS